MKTESERPRLKVIAPLIALVLVVFTAPLLLRLWRSSPEASPPANSSPAEAPAAPPEARTAPDPAPAPPPATVEQKWGIQIKGLHLAAAGTVLDMRYTVLDPDKAAQLVKQDRTTYLIAEATGTKLPLPDTAGMGSMRRTAQKLTLGYTYALQFPNPGRQIQKGDKLTLMMGNFRAEHLTVE